jgi:Tfp pilus assembly protein PilF
MADSFWGRIDMDCRTTLGLALCLLGGAAGCQHQVVSGLDPVHSPMPLQAGEKPPDPSQIKKLSALPKKDPPALVVVKLADFKAGEAFSADIPPDRQQRMRDEARDDYQRALKIDPKCLPAHQGLARLYMAMEDYGRAAETYQKALEVAPKVAPLWYELGRCLNYQKNRGQALECLNRAVQLEPENRDYLNTLGVLLAQVGRYQESLDCFVRSSGDSLGHYRLARTLQHLQQPELSRQYLEVALQKNPNLAMAQAMRTEMDGPTNSPNPASLVSPLSPPSQTIQRTSYQEPSVPAEPAAAPVVVAPPADTPLPQIINLNSSGTNAAEKVEEPTGEQTFVLPPPPIDAHYDAPADSDGKKR